MEAFGSILPANSLVIIFIILAASLVFGIGLVLYNVLLHPLASYAGPWYATCSPLWYVISLFRGTIAFDVQKLHERYGDVVRISPSELSYRQVEAWKDIYGPLNELPDREMGKDLSFYGGFAGGTATITTANHDDHVCFRRLLAPAFSQKALADQEPLIKQYIELLIQRLHERTDTKQNISAWFNFTTFDIVGDLSFGESFQCLEKADYNPWVTMIFVSLKASMFIQGSLRFPGLSSLLQWYYVPKEILAHRKEHVKLTQAKLDKRITASTDRKDLLSYFLRSNKLSHQELRSNSSTLIIAGSETTATTLTGTTYLLLRAPLKMAELVSEIRSTFAREEDITMLSVNRLDYMAACFEEGMRMYPAIPTGLPRRVPDCGAMVCGRWVPGKTSISVTHWAAYRSSANFRNPNSFVPERWMGDPMFAGDQRGVMQPFHIGPRNCLGRSLAYVEMRWIMARVLWNFDLELAPESERWIEQTHYMVWQREPLFVRVKSRKNE